MVLLIVHSRLSGQLSFITDLQKTAVRLSIKVFVKVLYLCCILHMSQFPHMKDFHFF